MSRTTDGLLSEISILWHGLVHMVSDPYHPERHYMRGAGPKSRASRLIIDPAQIRQEPVLLYVRACRRTR